MIPILLIDTSLIGAAVAVIDLGSPNNLSLIISRKEHLAAEKSAQLIPTLVDSALSVASQAFDDLAGVVCSTGPGSFTGIRVGLAFAYGLATGSKKRPLFGALSSVQCLADELFIREQKNQLVFLPATRLQGYMVYRSDVTNGRLASIELSTEQGVEAVINQLSGDKLSDAQITVVGQPWAAMDAMSSVNSTIRYLPVETASSIACQGMARHAKEMWPHGFSSELPAPRYLRDSAPERQRQQFGANAR